MKKLYFALLLQLCIVPTLLVAMEKEQQLSKYIIPGITNVRSIGISSDNKVCVGTNEGFCIYNPQTQKTTYATGGYVSQVITHPTLPIAASLPKILEDETYIFIVNFFDTTKEEHTHQLNSLKPQAYSACFNHTANEFVIYNPKSGLLELYDYHTREKIKSHTIKHTMPCNRANIRISHHPTEELITCPRGMNTIVTVKYEPFGTFNNNLSLPRKHNDTSHVEYNNSGEFMLVFHTSNSYTFFDVRDLAHPKIEQQGNKYVDGAFHPTKMMFAVLRNDNTVEYRGYYTENLIARTCDYYNLHDTTFYAPDTKRIVFSRDGHHVAVAIGTTCLFLPVPSINCLFPIYVALKNINLPTELIIHIFSYILKTHAERKDLELKYINYPELLKLDHQ